MKIAFVTQPYDGVLPPRQNSIGLIMYYTALELARHSEVTVFMKRRPEDDAATDLPFRTERVEPHLDDCLANISTSYPRWAEKLGLTRIADRHPHYARLVRARLTQAAPDVVHVMNYWSWCRDFSRTQDRRAVVLEMQAEWLSQMNVAHVSAQLQHTDAVVTVSDHISRLFKEAFPSYDGIVATAYNGVDVDVFKPMPAEHAPAKREPSVLFVGRTSPEKGVHVLIRAFAQIAAKHPDARLDIVGPRTTLPARFLVDLSTDQVVRRLRRFYDGTATDYQQHLEELAKKSGVADRIRFHGSLPHEQLVERYRTAAMLCNPSYSESFGISIVEGMACGIPVIGSHIGGMRETLVHGESGFHVEADEPDALAAAMDRVLSDSALAARLGSNGRMRAVELFSWEARGQRLLDIYRRATV